MPKGIPKQAIPLTFGGGLDTKTDRKQVKLGKFLSMKNRVFNQDGLMEKRNGYGALTALPDSTSDLVTTFNGSLTAVGTSILALSEATNSWVNKGRLQPVQLETLPLIRSNTNQSQCDTAIADNGLVCTVFTDDQTAGTVYRYAIADSVTGQNIVAPSAIPVTSGVVTGAPKVFVLGRYFVIVFTNVITATNHLQYVAISTTNPSTITANTDISAAYTPATTVAFDGAVANNSLYVAWNGNDGGGAVRMAYLSSTLVLSSPKVVATEVATIMSVSADTTASTPVIWASYYNSATNIVRSFAVTGQLVTILAPTTVNTTTVLLNVASASQNGVNTIFYEVSNNYTYDGAIPTHYVASRTINTAGTVGSQATVSRSVGLASKAFIIDSIIYLSTLYYSINQPTYFVMNSSGNIVARFAYSNGGVYYTHGLPNVTVTGSVAQVGYLVKDTIEAVNKDQGVVSANGVYSQTGLNLATLTFETDQVSTAEIGQNLHITGGFLWDYDGYVAVENGFFVWPDNVEVTTSGTGGLITAQQYYYIATYEWADNQGNINRSAPSIPISITTTGATSSNTVNVPTLRLTYKTANPVKIVIYRWSVAQQTFYQVTSITAPTMNDKTTDSIAYVDTKADSAIIGNNILYTAGGVIENIAPPSFSNITLFDDRLWGIDSEDRNLLWYSKQIIESTPVDMSDLLTVYVAPNIGSQGSTGPNQCLAPMDDKLIIFKNNAILYVNGTGPDNTGANGQYSQPTFITATVGCINQHSIVLTPNGLMFESDKGIWILQRDLQTMFIGEDVEAYTQGATVQSAVNVPGVTQIRFTLNTGVTLMFDYYYGQWGIFENVAAISSTLYEGLHTYINQYGLVFQETPGAYLDGSSPVLTQFTTSWINLAGLQGYERFYFFQLLGEYFSPHKLYVTVAYDYNSSATMSKTITPTNSSAAYGANPLYGDGAAWGNSVAEEQWQVFVNRQKCQSFQISVQEIYDPSLGIPPGAGYSLSGLNLIIGMKKGYRPMPSTNKI